MLEMLHLKNVGPAPEMKLEFAPRLNVITGDNGLGKSFILDCAWFGITGTWSQDINAQLIVGNMAYPNASTDNISAEIEMNTSGSLNKNRTYRFDIREQQWTQP
jgi:recombinational DNA repair ATPase RecF